MKGPAAGCRGVAALALALAPAAEVAAIGAVGLLPAHPAWTDHESLFAARCAVAGGNVAELALRRPGGLSLTAVLERTSSTRRGYSLSGRLAGAPDSVVTLAASGGAVYGTAWTPEGSYQITAVPPRLGGEPLAPECEGLDAGGGSDGAADGGVAVLDLAVLYLPAARLWAGGQRAALAMVDHDVAWANDALARGDVALRVELVAAAEFAGHWTVEQLRIESPTGRPVNLPSEIPATRERYAADVVALAYPLGDGGGAYGQGGWLAEWGLGSGSRLAHALGRVMGLHFESRDPWHYGVGYWFAGADGRRYCTIMCAGPAWGGTPFDVRLPHFSNPRQRFQGHPLGVPGERPSDDPYGPADAARALNEARHEVAALRPGADRCGYRLAPALADLPPAGGVFQVRVEADPGCVWSARAVDDVATVESGASGVGNGAVAYRVAANAGWEREVALAIGGAMHVATQPGARPVAPVCERSAPVRRALSAAAGVPCGAVGAPALAAVAHLDLGGGRSGDGRWRVDEALAPTAPAPGDFDGLANLNRLNLAVAPGHVLRSGLFDGLASLERLELHNANVGGAEQDGYRRIALAAGAFDGLPKLRHLTVHGAELGEVRFGGLAYLRHLDLRAIAGLGARTFQGLSNLRELDIGRSDLSDLRAGTFSGLDLWELRLTDLAAVSLPAGVFAGLGVYDLEVSGRTGGETAVRLGPLGPDTFDGMSYLGSATFRGLQLQLRPGAFRGVSDLLWRLRLNSVGLSNLAPDTFRGLGNLAELSLSNLRGEAGEVLAAPNDLRTLPPGIFRGLSLWKLELAEVGLEELDPAWYADLATSTRHDQGREQWDHSVNVYLRGNLLTAVPADLLRTVPISGLDLADNRLQRLPPGLFGGLTYRYLRLKLQGNPGAPFALSVRVAATGRSSFALELPLGAPRDLDFFLSVVQAGRLLGDGYVQIAAGETSTPELQVVPRGGDPVVARAYLTAYLAAWCGDLWGPCLAGIEVDLGGPLLVYPDGDFQQNGPPWRMGLEDVFPDIDVAGATFTATSSDSAIATATVAGGALVVSAGAPGDATVTVTGVLPDGRSATRTFTVHVPVEGRPFLRGWRWSLAEGA